MKVIDLLNGIANGKYDDFKTKFIENGEVYNMRTFKNLYILDNGVLNLEIKLLNNEDEFIDIEEIDYAIEIKEYKPYTINIIFNSLRKLCKNQKLLIDKINKLEGK